MEDSEDSEGEGAPPNYGAPRKAVQGRNDVI
jgi:hypothetical protein